MKDHHPVTIGQSMKGRVISICEDAMVLDAVRLFLENHIGTLPVVDSQMKLVGLVTMETILSLVMPDFVHLMDRFSFVHDLGAVETRTPDENDLRRCISEIMTAPVFVEEGDSLLYAAASKRNHGLRDIPVVDAQRHLVGIASHVDIGTALMRSWKLEP